MKTLLVVVIVLLAAALGAGGGYWFGHRGAGEKPAAAEAPKEEEKPKAVPTVSVAAIRRGPISEQMTAYGMVMTPASAVAVVSVPFESRVAKVAVAPGETVAKDQLLMVVEPSPAAALAWLEAQNAASAAQRDMDLVRKRYDQKLATNSELNAATSANQIAQGRLNNLKESHADGPRELKAPAAGIVNKIDVQLGQVTPIGGPLIEVAAQDQVEVKLGVEPSSASLLKEGQAVRVRPLYQADGPAIEGTIRLIGQRVDATSRLVDVMVKVTLANGSKLALDSAVVGLIAVRTVPDALVVPRDTALPSDEGGFEVFTIKDKTATKHTVQIGIETDTETQILSDELKEGDTVVTVGNHELEDGMKVEVPTPTTQPSSQPAACGEEKVPDADFVLAFSCWGKRDRTHCIIEKCAVHRSAPHPSPHPRVQGRGSKIAQLTLPTDAFNSSLFTLHSSLPPGVSL